MVLILLFHATKRVRPGLGDRCREVIHLSDSWPGYTALDDQSTPGSNIILDTKFLVV
jgi:hypothetical protein